MNNRGGLNVFVLLSSEAAGETADIKRYNKKCPLLCPIYLPHLLLLKMQFEGLK